MSFEMIETTAKKNKNNSQNFQSKENLRMKSTQQQQYHILFNICTYSCSIIRSIKCYLNCVFVVFVCSAVFISIEQRKICLCKRVRIKTVL